jgi:transposase
MLTAERNRLPLAHGRVRHRLQAHIHYLEQELTATNDPLRTSVRESPLWRATDQPLQSVPGIGPTTATTLIVELPHPGRCRGNQSPPSWGSRRSTATVGRIAGAG